MTLRHIVTWKLNGETLADRNEQAQKIKDSLEALDGKIDELRAINVYRNELHEGANFDVTLIADFDNEEQLASYAVHPLHVPVVEMIKTMASDRVAVDFTVE